jgi:FkbM family methyltransferase
MQRMLASAKHLINQGLQPLGHTIAHEPGVPSQRRFFATLRANGLAPRTVFDIGVAEGTPWLYDAFPDALYYLVDPTRESLPHMQRWAQRLQAEVLNVALGAHAGTAVIDVRDDIGGSTFFREVGAYVSVAKYEVPVQRFDALIGDFARPALCKIDVQGAELMVLEGMSGRIRDIDAIVIETSSLATIEDGPEIFAVMAKLKDYGFVLCDVLGLCRRPLDQALAQLDLAFVPETSQLRQDRRWSGSR